MHRDLFFFYTTDIDPFFFFLTFSSQRDPGKSCHARTLKAMATFNRAVRTTAEGVVQTRPGKQRELASFSFSSVRDLEKRPLAVNADKLRLWLPFFG